MVAELVPRVGYHKCTCGTYADSRYPHSLTFCRLLVLVFSQLAMLRKGLIEAYGIVLAFAGQYTLEKVGLGEEGGRGRMHC
jgi:hypothetical protein